jgi:hypothetical protein
VATFPVRDAPPQAGEHPAHQHQHLVDAVGPEEAARYQAELSKNAKRYNVPTAWASDPRAVNAAEILHRSKVRQDACRQLPEERLWCECLRGTAAGARALVRSFIADGRKWIVTSSFKIGNDEVGRVRVPALAEPIPLPGQRHVENLIAVCEHCLRGLVVQPKMRGVVHLTRLDAPTFGVLAE